MMPSRSLSRIGLNVLLDGCLAALAVPAARWLVAPHAGALPAWWIALGVASLLAAAIPLRLPKQYWRFAGIGDLVSVAAASVAGAALFTLALLGLGASLPSASFPAVHALTLLVLLGAPRVAYRLSRGSRAFWTSSAELAAELQSVLLVGAGEGVDLFLRALAQERRPSFRVVGLLSLSARQTGRRIRGCPILGTADDLGPVLTRLRAAGQMPGMLAVTAPDLTGPALSRLLSEADRQGLQVRLAPRPTSLRPAAHASGRAVAAPALELKPVALEDLLNRPQVPLDREAMARLVQGRCVLVTGAGGTIGSELARQVATLGPDRLILLDNGEYALWQIDLELAETHPAVRRQAVIADIRDEARIRAVIEAARPELVFHAAALKHVPIVESNPLEGLLTNAVGTRHVADAARAAGARAMVLISTDKAVNPTSVMGASKRLAEMYCQALDRAGQTTPGGMRCATVRFGNVLGSTGSVVPLFRRQLERGGPLTVTHPDMQRYFMTVREAVGLVLQATVVGTGVADAPDPSCAEAGGIFVLDMGEPVKIVELARQLIRLAGLRPDADVEIRFTGLRPGEKLYEELFHGKEPPSPTPYPGLLMATPRVADPAIVARAIQEVAAFCRAGETALALATLSRLVPEFEHNPTGAAGTARI